MDSKWRQLFSRPWKEGAWGATINQLKTWGCRSMWLLSAQVALFCSSGATRARERDGWRYGKSVGHRCGGTGRLEASLGGKALGVVCLVCAAGGQCVCVMLCYGWKVQELGAQTRSRIHNDPRQATSSLSLILRKMEK